MVITANDCADGDAMKGLNRRLMVLRDGRDLVAVLKEELAFLEKGGYQHTQRAAWRPHFMFQDSPTCLNFDSMQQPRPCSECVLTQLVPEDLRKEKIPCRYIPLNERGETIDSFYRYGTQKELEAAVGQWLKTTIARLEREKAKVFQGKASAGRV